MARRSRRTMPSVFAQFLKTVFRRQEEKRPQRRGFAFESLEARAMLASDLGAISGLIYRDATGDGFTAGEEVAGATVNLYIDDGDGVFEPAGDDAPATAGVTDANGRYRFDGLAAGDYWIEQPAQTVGAIVLSAQNSALITITALEAQGTVAGTIDDYTETGPSLSAGPPVGTQSLGTALAASALGGERDLLVEFTSGSAGETVDLEAISTGLSFDASLTSQGRYVSVWDGIDGDASAINFAGLGNHDLTSGGTATGIRLLAGADQSGATARLRIYSDANNWSEQAIAIPATPGSELIFLFSGFATGGGASGPADFASVNAIEMQIDTTVDATDGLVQVVETIAPTVKAQDFANSADLSLTKTVDIAAPSIGQDVTFTITVANAGPGAANNVVVTDLLPAGLDFVSSTPSQGSYDNITGIWTVGSIDAGADATLGIVATVTTLDGQENVAEVTGVDEFDPDSTPGNNDPLEDDQDSVIVDAALIDLSLSKSADNVTPDRDQQVTFTIIVANAGPDNATGVVVNDDLPPGMTFVSAVATQGTYDPETGLWTVGTVNSGADATLTLAAIVTTSDPKINTAEVVAADQADVDSTPNNNNSEEDDQQSVTLTPTIADISVTKTADNLTPDRDDVVTFTIVAANGGPDAATDIVITDLLPAGLSLDSFDAPAGTAYNQTTGEWTIDSLASGADVTLTLSATATTSGAKVNSATLTSLDQFDTNGQNDSASVTITPEETNLAVTKTVDNATPDKNDLITFTIVVSNTGPVAATNVVVTDQLPAGLQFGTATTATGSYNQTNGQWTIDSLASGASATLTLTATATSDGVQTNTAQVTASDQFDGNAADDQDSVDVTPQVADLSVIKEVDDATPNNGQLITFTIRVTNSSTTQQATGVTLADQIPAGMTFGTATTAAGTYDQNTGIWNIGTIAAGTTVELTITATNTTADVKQNTARLMTSDQFDPDSTPGNTAAGEDDESTITITPNVADVRLSKQVSNAAPQVGQNVTFTITATNDGPQAASGLQVTDLLPAGLTFVSATASVGTYTQATGLWDIGGLNSGASATLTIVATASQPGQVVNSAEVTAMNEFDSDSTPNNNVPTEDDQASATINTTQLISPRLCTIVWRRSAG
ncbi:MAG TPA: SpaA isopeptide-forming pilin-related protein [Pirellulaceae bacterium]|nr:SpaA isopeptide-forming pilin-related protein [Pirellulaceae bacterium]